MYVVPWALVHSVVRLATLPFAAPLQKQYAVEERLESVSAPSTSEPGQSEHHDDGLQLTETTVAERKSDAYARDSVPRMGVSPLSGPLAYSERTEVGVDIGPSKYQYPCAVPRTYVGTPASPSSKQWMDSLRAKAPGGLGANLSISAEPAGRDIVTIAGMAATGDESPLVESS
jgi:hypothetical protein